ncbi:hypothetical protein [Modestobacter versicolor]|uniref:ElaB/YqjD/DUF883 family membrane-anchored ribosome-binding protein n=1 Tax=Modestobacter versicolor TaxID=429133 RepID=A0A323V4B4_9ACTN|nr:hypothetical protein [Modestobacter versicolor]MBB3676159.1 ElaB/YqjD/DUF883 family membrane-anchored ribosome-binding protein [Modestobacter versicolor]PZA19582.1 hypothetical protein DMO24_19970 [Modestobacter versicolor]
MTHSIDTPTQSPPSGASNVSGTPSTKDVAKDEASNVASTAAQAGSQVASTAADQAKQVTQETKRQAQDLIQQGRSQLQDQARNGQQKAGEGISGIAQQLRTMVEGGGETPSGPAADLVRQAGDKLEELATWVQAREPGDLVDEVRAFARRKPGVFLLGAALAGVVAGRLTTGVVAAHKDSSPSTGNQQLTGQGSPYAADSYSTGTNYVADTPATGYATTGTAGYETGYVAGTTGTTGSVPPPPYGTVPPEGTSVPPATSAGWDDPARTPGSGQL